MCAGPRPAPRMPPDHRARAWYTGLGLTTTALGLGVHLGGSALPPAVRDILGDALWAAMLAWWIGALVPAWPLARRAVLALAGSYLVEASQLLHAPGLDAVRRTRLGHLVLGSGFDPRDLLAYAGGVLAAVLIERAWRRSRRAQAATPSGRTAS